MVPVLNGRPHDYRPFCGVMPGTTSGSSRLSAPATNTQEGLAALREDLLKAGRIGIHDNFFDGGGNSVRAIDLIVRIGSEFRKILPLSVVLTERPSRGSCR